MQLQIFEYKEEQTSNNIRTVDIEGEIWFVANDVCRVLGYEKPNNAINRHCKPKGTLKQGIPTEGGIQEMVIINEPNVYRLIIRSALPNAEKFENWIFNEVIPSIRKTGRYGIIPIFVRRFNDNWDRVTPGNFSIISELFIRVYGKFEQAGYIIRDKSPKGIEIRPDVSVGKTFPAWLEKRYPDKKDKFKFYYHILPNGMEVEARQYENEVLPCFIEYVEKDWLYNRAQAYFETRDIGALGYLPKILEGQKEKPKRITAFDKKLKGLLNVPPENKTTQ